MIKRFLRKTGEASEELNDKSGEVMLKAVPQRGLDRWELPNPDRQVMVLGDSEFIHDRQGKVYGTMMELPGKLKREVD